MARLIEEGMDELIRDLEQAARIPDGVAEGMLRTQAGIVVEAQKRELARQGLVRSGQLRDAIQADQKMSAYGGSRYVNVYPKGNRKKKTKYRSSGGKRLVTNNEVGFVLEYGAPRRKLKARNWMEKANASCADRAVEAARAVYEKWLASQNL